MTAIPIQNLYDEIRPHAMIAPIPLIDTAIRRAAREYCFRTKLRRKSVQIAVQAQKYWYPLLPPDSDEEVIEIQAAQYNVPSSSSQLPMEPCTPEDVNTDRQYSSYPNLFYLEIPARIVIGPPKAVNQTVQGGLYVRTILQPTKTANTLDPGVLMYGDRGIADGALKWLLGMTAEAWYDPREQQQMEKNFEREVKRVKSEADRAFMQTDVFTSVYKY